MDAIIGLGSNLGQRLQQLRTAVTALAALGTVRARSAVYETTPVGQPTQPDYLNAAVWLRTELGPMALLAALNDLQTRAGRPRDPAQRSSSRTLDLDMLLLGEHGQSVLVLPGLVVPHPHLHERACALRPALDLDAGLQHPALGVSLGTLLATIPAGEQTLRKVGWL